MLIRPRGVSITVYQRAWLNLNPHINFNSLVRLLLDQYIKTQPLPGVGILEAEVEKIKRAENKKIMIDD